MINIIVACDKNNVIGNKGKIPWHLKCDFANFKKITSGHTVVMGRKTFESIGKPLPNRKNIVLTKDRDWKADGVTVLYDPNVVLNLKEDIFILGGEKIYSWFSTVASKYYITRVNANTEGDAFFPGIPEDYELTFKSETFEENGLQYWFEEWEVK